MAEQMTFEARLDAALGRYADRVPAQVDVASVVRTATTTTVPTPLTGAFARSTWATWLRLGVVAALLAAAAIIAIAVAQQNSKPLHGGGKLLVGVRTSGWVFDPSLGAPVQIELNASCYMVDGGSQLALQGSHLPTRVQPIGDPSTVRGVTSLTIPGFGGTNMERWSPDGSRYALMRFGQNSDEAPVDAPGALMIVSIHGVEDPVRQVFEIRGASGFAWSRNSAAIAAIGRRGDRYELLVFDLIAGTQQVVASTTESIAFDPGGAWTAGDSVVAVVVQTPTDFRPALIDVAGGSLRRLPDPAGLFTGAIGYAIWSPDGKRAILMGEGGPIAIVDANGAKVSDLPPGTPLSESKQFQPSPWSSDSRHFAMTDGPLLRVVDADGNIVGQVALPLPVEGFDPPVAWAPDGASIAVADATSDGIRVRILDAADLHQQSSALIPTGLDGALCLQWALPIDPGWTPTGGAGDQPGSSIARFPRAPE